jgi:hypothetical protein
VANSARYDNPDGKNEDDEKTGQPSVCGLTFRGWLTGTIDGLGLFDLQAYIFLLWLVMKMSDTYLRFMVFNQRTSIYV